MHPKPLLRLLLLALAVVAAGGGPLSPASQDEKAAETDEEAPTPRVIIHVDRNTAVMGYVELEEEEVLVVRTLDGQVRSFAKSRVVQIVRLVEPRPGQTGVVVLRNGQLHEGVILEDGFDHVLVEIEGIRARFRRQVVDHVVLNPMFEEQYAAYKETLKPDMALRHLALCQWLVDERRYELAQQELAELLANHDLPEAQRLMRLVRAQLALREKPKRSTSDEEEGDGPGGDQPPAGEVSALPQQLLTDDDVNIIRVFEIDFAHPPKVLVDRETIRRLLERYGENKLLPASQTERERIYRADSLAIVRLMFQLRARDLYPQIQVLSEPYALNLFRQRVHDTFLINNCTTSRCHGGLEGGRLFLHRRDYKDAPVRYTNLLILERLKLDPQWPLINYEEPGDSLLIQYGLPREKTRKPHPPARGWKPAFRRPDDRMVRYTIQWIRAMFKPRPEYPVDYEPPRLEQAGTADPHEADEDRAPR